MARLILVDDDDASRQTLATLLLPERHEVVALESGAEVLAWLDENACPDLLLSDVMMPGMDGFELCAAVRARPDTRTLPIVLVTALDRREDVIRGLESGADEFLSKPVSGPELRARVRTMLRIKSQQDSLREALALREDLTRLIVHDMRNPLAAIQIYLQCGLKRPDLPETLREDLTAALGGAQSLNDMVNEMLIIARMEHGSLTLERSNSTLGTLVRSAAAAPYLVDNAHRLQIEVPSEEPVARWDVRLLHRVLDNLLTNAVKYTPQSLPIILRLAYAEGRARLEVRDQGAGIPEEHRDRIFEKFAVIPIKTKVTQTGLGLYFCRLVAEAHGGTIRAEANEPRGAAFILDLPLEVD